jgi:hypothetical protein
MARAFRQHPDSVAGRIAAEQLEGALEALRRAADDEEEDGGPDWLDLTLDSTDEEIEAARRATFGERDLDEPLPAPPPRAAATIYECPLDLEWRRWDMFNSPRYHTVPDDARPVVEAARRAEPLRHLGLVPLSWETAEDDSSYLPMTTAESGEPEWRWEKGSPGHLHAEADVDGRRVHVDWTHAHKHGPGRTITEIRIFVDGRLAGRGGSCGCSLGVGGNDLPAVALISSGRALSVDDVTDDSSRKGVVPQLVAELWEVRSGPDSP